MRIIWSLAMAVLLAACAQQTPTSTEACAAPAEDRAVAQLYFGRNIGAELGVDDPEWASFVDTEISPRFPDGLTVDDVDGQWRDTETDDLVREPSKRVTLVLGDEAADRASLDLIADAYKAQFQQQAVMLVVEHSCVSFE